MRRCGLARGRALIACAATAVVFAGCTTQATSTVTVSGKNLTIYLAAPPNARLDARAQDVLDAEQLAFGLQHSSVPDFTLRLKVLHGAKVSDNARTVIQDDTAIAYLGDIIPGDSADSLGILNYEDVLQVSPTDTAVELTQPSAAVPGSPDLYYESLSTFGRTFARVVPTTALEARALLAELVSEHVSHVYLTTDGQPYGAALAAALRHTAGAAVTVTSGRPVAATAASSGAQAVLFATASPSAAQSLFNRVAAVNSSLKLFAASALDDTGFVAGLSPQAAAALRVSSPGFTSAALNGPGQGFVTAFTSAYGHAPSTQAIFGYEAMSAVLSVLKEAGKGANNRSTVQRDFFAIHNRDSVLGTYSINANGDTSVAPFVISRVRLGRLVPFRFVSEQG